MSRTGEDQVKCGSPGSEAEPQFLTVLEWRESVPGRSEVEGVVVADLGATVRLEIGPDVRYDFDAKELRAALGFPSERFTRRSEAA